MRETLVEARRDGNGLETPPAPPVMDPVVSRWRQEWDQGVAEADAAARTPSGDPRLSLRRRDFGSYLFAGIDVVLALVGQVVLSVLLLIPATILYVRTGHGLSSPDANAALTAWLGSSPLYIATALVATEVVLVLVLWYRRTRLRLGWNVFGLGAQLRTGIGRAVLIGLAIGIAGLILSDLYTRVFHDLFPKVDLNGQDRLLVDPLRHAPAWQVWTEVLAGTFLAPAAEELFFRGYLFRAFAVRKGIPAAYLLSAGLFALSHLVGGGDLLPIIPALFIVGLLLCFAYHRTGNLVADVTAHALNNGAAFAVALLPLPFLH